MRLTHASYAVAELFMSVAEREWYGKELLDLTPVSSGVLYPMLAKMRDAGWLDDRWEEPDAHVAGRPPRRYYRVTPDGREAMAAMLDRASRDRRFSDSLAR